MKLRENILYDDVYDAAHYERVIDACALREDLNYLPNADSTEIGDKVREYRERERERGAASKDPGKSRLMNIKITHEGCLVEKHTHTQF